MQCIARIRVWRPALLLGLAFALCAHTALAVDAITVDAAVIVHDAARGRMGINTSYLTDSERARRDVPPRTTQAALQDMKMKFLRYPGGEESDGFLWSVPPWIRSEPTLARTGPNEWPANSRQFTTSDAGGWIPGKEPLDFDEFMAMARNAGAEPVIVVAYDGMYKALTPGGTRPTRDQLLTAAVEWVRYANVVKGYGVKYWSIGNETDYFSDGNPGPAQYAADVREFSRRMKAVDPSILIGAQVGVTEAWLQALMSDASADIDFIDVHAYPTNDWTAGYEAFRTGTPNFVAFVDRAIQLLSVHVPPADRGRLKVIVSEFAAHDFSGYWPDRNDTGHALVLFDIVGQMLTKPELAFIQFAATHLFTNNTIESPSDAANRLANPGFEADLAEWTPLLGPGGASVTSDPANVHGGSKALVLTGDTESARAQTVTDVLQRDAVYTLTIWAKHAGTGDTPGCGIEFFQDGVKVGSTIIPFSNDGEYKRYAMPIRTPAAFDLAIVWIYKPGSPADALYVDDLAVSSGGVPIDLEAVGPDNELLPSGRMLAIWTGFLQDKLVGATGTSMVPAYASVAAASSALTVFLVNKDTAPHDATVELRNHASGTSAARWVFKGLAPEDLAPTWTQSAAVNVSNNRMALVLDPLSVTVLRPDVAAAPDNYQGLWWNAPAGSESGWGVNFAHQGDTVFATWFTFGVDGKPLWLVAAATKTGPAVYSGTLYTGTGPAYNAAPFDPARVVATAVGSATFAFSDNSNASFTYTIGSVAQTKAITREQFAAPVPTCVWGAQPDLAAAANYQDMWWAAPAGAESGWGINFAHQGDTVFGTWFTFDLDGKPLWLAVAAPKIAPDTYSGTLYTGTGPAFDSVPFDPSRVTAVEMGTATFTFVDGNNATFRYTINGVTQSKSITREVFAAPGTVCAVPPG